ncbi:MAG TPA: hydrogenase nickel incorporation protein HypB [Thermoanaerobaculia bacterium]|nr:hydrogenase nickel incorporation protein HypB [Thermoanaerobaculia bacterium]
MSNVVPVEKKVLSENARIAAELRERFARSGTLVVNLISAPGSGKTRLLERTLESLPEGLRVAVLTGDIQTERDAERLARFGYPVRQITTGGTCHLDASMIMRHLEGWKLDELDILFIENVGNLVCPSSYDLGEEAKIVLLSVTEGDEKPLKYPSIFFKSKLILITKTDLLPYVPFDLAQARANARSINQTADIIEVSTERQEGLMAWMDWLFARKYLRMPQSGGKLIPTGGSPWVVSRSPETTWEERRAWRCGRNK